MGIELKSKAGSVSVHQSMLKGDDGGYYTPSVDAEGNLTWTPSESDMPPVAGANIKGKTALTVRLVKMVLRARMEVQVRTV